MKEKTTEIYTQDELCAKSEIALMGLVTPARDKDNIVFMLDYICKVLNVECTGEEIYEKSMEFIDSKKTYPIGICCSILLGGECRVINIVFRDVKGKFKLEDPDGVLTYVYNLDWPDCSELGYCFFEHNKNGTYHRIA